MERYQKLKDGLERLNILNQDISSQYNDQENITSKLEKHVVKREKLLEEMPPKPDYDKFKSTSLKINEERRILDSLPTYRERAEFEPIVDDSFTIAEGLLWLISGLVGLGALGGFFTYGIPTMELAQTDPDLDLDYWTIVDFLLFLSIPLTFGGYIGARREMFPVLKRGVSLLELPGVVMIWIGVVFVLFSATEPNTDLVVNILVVLIFLLPGLGSFYAVKVSQRRKYYSVEETLLGDLNEAGESIILEENLEIIAQRKSTVKLLDELEKVNSALSEDIGIYEEITTRLDGLEKAIERETKRLNKKLEEIAETDSQISNIWSSIESMVPKSEMQPTNA